MTHQTLQRNIRTYRIGDPAGRYPIFDARGSILGPGRWNTPTAPMIYTALTFSLAMLEKLVHGSGSIPPHQHYIEIDIPHGVSYEKFNVHTPANKGWDDISCAVSKSYGEAWYAQKRSLLLFVPSAVARVEENVLINPDHGDFAAIHRQGCVSHHQPVHWDPRLYGSVAAP